MMRAIVNIENVKNLARLGVLFLLVAGMAGCAAQKAYKSAERHVAREAWDRAVLDYSKAIALDPGNTRYSVALERAKLKSSMDHFNKGKRYAAAGQLELAISEYQQTLLLNSGNQYAYTELQRAIREYDKRHSGPSEMERKKAEAKKRDLAPPKLDPGSNIPILLQFRDSEVGKIFEAISKASQINFIFDEKTDLDQKLTIDIGNVTLEKALDILMLQTKNFYKVIDENTLLIAPDTRQARQTYEDRVIRTFYLSNGDTKQVVTLLRSLLQSRQIAENPDLNSVTIKDKPDVVAIAEHLIKANDKSKGEVLIDVELLEINRQLMTNIGVDLNSKVLSLSFKDGLQSVPLNNLDQLNQQGNWSIGVVPSVVLNFLKSDSESRSIAKPQIRVTEGEQAEILIGDRVPIPTTSFNSSQTIGGNIVPITSFTYQNVGITVNIEPRVHHNREVSLKFEIEVSQISSFVEASGGLRQPVIGTRTIKTVIRLKDGETNMLAGLIKTEDTDTHSGVAGLMNTPGLGSLFRNRSSSGSETDLILTLTPHIVRIPDITEEDMLTLWVGTEENTSLRGETRIALGASPFARANDGEEPDSETVTLGEAGSTPGGTISRTTSSDAVRQEAANTESSETSSTADRTGRDAALPAVEPADDAANEPDPDNAGSAPETPAVVRMIPSQTSYRVGDTIEIQVMIENATNVGSVPFRIIYDQNVVEFLDPAGEGPFLGSDGAGTMFLARASAGGGEVVVGLSRIGSVLGVEGAGVLTTLQFQAMNPGDAVFSFTAANVKDPGASNLPASFIPVSIRVEP